MNLINSEKILILTFFNVISFALCLLFDKDATDSTCYTPGTCGKLDMLIEDNVLYIVTGNTIYS